MNRRLRQRGEFNWVVPAMLLAFAASIYAAFVFLPPWSRARRVQASMKEAVFGSWKQRDKSDMLKNQILGRRKDLWARYGDDPEYPQFTEHDIIVTWDSVEMTVTVEIAFQLTQKYPFMEKYRTIDYALVETGSTLSPAAEEAKKGKGFLEELFE